MRWRDVKNKKFDKQLNQEQEILTISLFLRFKVFVIDMFMIYIPILYITYFILGKEGFLNNQIAIFIDTCLYGIILSLFYSIKSQSPGLKAYNLKLQTVKNTKLNFPEAFFRYFLFLISGSSIIGLAIAFFRKDKLCFHDIISKTRIIKE